MFITTEGVVLKCYPFRDHNFIAKIFTCEDGLLSFIIKKTKNQLILSQPLTIVEITYKKRGASTLYQIKEASVQYPYQNLVFNNRKIQIALVLSEILHNCLGEKNQKLYKFIVKSFKWLDIATGNYSGFKNLFLIKLCAINGLKPYESLDISIHPNQQLDIEQGMFIETLAEQNSNEAEKRRGLVPLKESIAIYKLSKLDFGDLETRDVAAELDYSVFNYLLKYISRHLTDLSTIKSLQILKEIF